MDFDVVQAGVLGAVVADALGVPYEFNSLEQMKKSPATGMTGFGTYNQPPGTWSDDSSMVLATLDSLSGGVDYEDMIGKFCEWIFDGKYTPHGEVFDYGSTTWNALFNFRKSHYPPMECGLIGERSNGNGSLMRMIPVSLYVFAKNLSVEDQMGLVEDVSCLTHAHRYSKASCNIYNFIVQEVLKNPGEKFSSLISRGIGESGVYYENEDYPCFGRLYGDFFSLSDEELYSGGYVVDSLEVALYSCYHSDCYEGAVLRAVNYGGDTDTNAVIAGGLAGLYYGLGSIPSSWLDEIARLDYIRDLCGDFYSSL